MVNDPQARAATPTDVPEIIRLVGEMYADMAEEYSAVRTLVTPVWTSEAEADLAERLGRDIGAFVVEGKSGNVLSVAVGRLSETLPSPRRVGKIAGYVEWVATDASFRRLGYAKTVVSQLLDWFRERGAAVVDLHSSSEAEQLYRGMGFENDGPVALSRRVF